jgi:hypothetical protein
LLDIVTRGDRQGSQLLFSSCIMCVVQLDQQLCNAYAEQLVRCWRSIVVISALMDAHAVLIR